MTDYQGLYLLMVCCYLLECLALMPGTPALFLRLPLRFALLRRPGCALSSDKRLLLLNPVPFLADWFAVAQPRATLTADGLITANSLFPYERRPPLEHLPTTAPEALPWLEELHQAGLRLPAGSSARHETAGQEGDPLAAFNTWVDPRPLRGRLRSVRGSLSSLRLLCTLSFLWVFAGAPLIFRVYPVDAFLLPYLLVLYWLDGCIATVYAFGQRRLHGRGAIPLLKALWLFAYPPAAMRAVALLASQTILPCHESAVADVLFNKAPIAAGNAGGLVPAAPRAGVSAAGWRYLAEIRARLSHVLFSRSLPEESVRMLAGANARLSEAISRAWGLPEQFPADLPGDCEPGALRRCPVCGLGLAAPMEFCPHCLEVRTRPTDKRA